MAVNGSDGNGGCPSSCVGVSSGITTCDCTDSAEETTTTGVFIDGVVPTLDTAERNTANEYMWAAPLLTVRGTTDSVLLGFRFQDSVQLREVQLHLFNCPAWNIAAQSIRIYDEIAFPIFSRVFNSIGVVTLTSELQSCNSTTRVSIPLQMASSTNSYFIEFYNPTGAVIQWLHIAEVRFSTRITTLSFSTTAITVSDPTIIPTTTSPDTSKF